MIITDRFVVLNYPKTGSTFVRAVLSDIHRQRLAARTITRKCADFLGLTPKLFFKELSLPNIKMPHAGRPADQHGCYCQIPDIYRDREVVTVVRNPYDRVLSAFEFRWWEKYPPVPPHVLEECFPSFPDLTIDDYLRLSELGTVYGRLNGRIPAARIGSQTVQFIQMFFKDPATVLAGISDDYIDSDQVFDDMADITFLRQENLNEELSIFLEDRGYSGEEVRYVRQKNRVNVTEKRVSERKNLWTEKILKEIAQNERMIFRILAARGIMYTSPSE